MAYSNFFNASPSPRLPYASTKLPYSTSTGSSGGPYIGTLPNTTTTAQSGAAAAPAAPATVQNPPASILKPGDIPATSTETPATPKTIATAQAAYPQVDPRYNLSQDPGYTQALSQFYGAGGAAASDYLGQVEQYLLGFGSQELAHKTLDSMLPQLEEKMQQAGSLGGGNHLDLNPFYESFYVHDGQGNRVLGADGQPLTIADPNQGFSTLAQQGRNAFNATRSQIDQNRLANLAYSTAGAQGLQNTAYNNQLALNTAGTTANANLASFLGGYQQNLGSAQSTLNGAAQSAYDRLLQWALAHPEASGTETPSGGAAGGGASAASTPPTVTNPYAPFAVKVTANKTGASANKKQGIFAIH